MVIVITGIMAAGKSTVTQILAERLRRSMGFLVPGLRFALPQAALLQQSVLQALKDRRKSAWIV